jgi:hypothetical protein
MKQKAINHQLILIIAIVLCASRVSALAVFVPETENNQNMHERDQVYY